VMPIMVMPIIVGVDDVCRGGDDGQATQDGLRSGGWRERLGARC
jgi:hypothetical protein